MAPIHSALLLVSLFLLITYSHAADQMSEFVFQNFSAGLPGVGNSAVNGALVMSRNETGTTLVGSTAWFSNPMQVRGFSTQFTYTISNRTSKPNQRPDGIAFVIQNSPARTGATGTAAGGLGYGSAGGNQAGIQNSVAVEFDSWYDPDLNDPDMFHIGVHSNGPNPNSADERYRIGNTYNNSAYNLDTLHVTITYDPVASGGTMYIRFNDQPLLTVSGVDIEELASLDPADGNAYVGFTAGSHMNSTNGAEVERISVTDWTFNFLGVISPANTIVVLPDNVTAGVGLTFPVLAVDQYNNTMIIDGVGRSNYALTANITQLDGTVITSIASYSGEGKYLINFNATGGGIATVRVYLNATLVGEGEYPLPVIPAEPFAPLSYPYAFAGGVSTPATAGVFGSFLVQLKDGFGNNITADVGPVVQAIITPIDNSSPVLTVVGVYDSELQLYTVTYNVTVAGNFTIQVNVNNSPTLSGSQALEVVPAPVDPGTSVLYGAPGSAIAGETQYVYLQLKDVFGNNASNADVDLSTISITATQENTPTVAGTVIDCTLGLCLLSYNLTAASYYSQQYILVVTVSGTGVVNSHTTIVKVTPAALSTSTSYAYGPGIETGVAGVFDYFYVQLTDAFGNNNSYPTTVVITKITAGTFELAPTPLPVNGGLYTFQYNLTWATNYELSITVNGSQIANSQNTVSISPNVVFPPNCEAWGDGIADQLVVGDNNVFYVQLRDEFLNNITINGTEALLVVLSSNSLTVIANTEFENGLYEVSYNITAASDYNVTITINNISILNSLEFVTLVPASIFPPECLALSLYTPVTAGEIVQFTVQLRDVYANNITSVPDATGIVTAVFAPNNYAINIEYQGSGVYLLSYNVTLASNYGLTILVNNTAISGGGQYTVSVVPAAAYPPLSFSVGSALVSSTAGANSSFIIYLFDAFNNSITNPSQSDTPVVTLGDQSFQLVFEQSIAAFEVFYNITVSNTYDVTVSVTGATITSSNLVVAPAALFVPNCLANGPSLPGTVAGDIGTFYVYQRDQFGNLIKDYTQVQNINVTLSLLNTTFEVVLPPTPNGDGSWTCTYNLTIAGYYETRITINGGDILGSPLQYTEIDAAPFNPHGTVTKGLSTSFTAGNLTVFTIQLRDIWGNDVTDNNVPNPIIPGDVDVQFNGTSVAINVTAQAAGVFQVEFNYTTAGTYWMSVTINQTSVGPNAVGYITVNPSSVYPPNCVAEGDATAEAIVKQTNTFTLVVRDVFGNDRMWSPTPPKISLTATGLAILYGSAKNESDGTYTISYFIEERTTYSMSVMFGDEHIHGSPFTVDTNYGNNSPSTVVIVCSVIGSVVVVGAIVGGFIWYRRRRQPYIALLG